MENERDSKEYSWKWITADEILSKVACDFLGSHHVPSTAGTSTIDIYDGENTSGKVIVKCRTAESRATPFHPPKPIYCRKGLYIDIKANCLGVFVMWRVRDSKEG